ncbi:hypothetical protein Bbelb_221500 [Branchiostoma belcheri]|nr:hypothetical protein Bbelb_221500 [Branchiostoma belcheri]
MSILNTTIFGGTCSTPEQLINITFESFDTSNNYFANVDSSEFLCAPSNVQASAASNREISLSWDLIPTLENIQPSVQQTNATMAGSNETGTNTTTYNQTMINTTMVNETVSNATDFNQTDTDLTNVSISNTTNLNQNGANITGVNNTGFNRTQTNETSVIDDEQPDQVNYPYYAVNCTSDTAPPINRGLIVQNSTVFNASDGVQAGTMYTCTVLYNDMGDFSASSWPVTVTTLQETEEIDVNSMQVPISYYDFSITHPDFDGRRQGELSDPTYVVNPFGGYLSTSDDPTLDSFARWFLSVPGDNYVREKILVLRQQNGTRYHIKCQGQTRKGPCRETYIAIRAALTYHGNEIITVGGGDELWLFLDRERVIDLRREKGDKSETTSCRRLKLQDSGSEGGVSAVLASGTVIDGECVIHGNVTNDTAKLDLTTTMAGEAEALMLFFLFMIKVFMNQRRQERVQRRRRLRRIVRGRRVLGRNPAIFAAAIAIADGGPVDRGIWARERSQHWWQCIVLETYTDQEFYRRFRMRRGTFHFRVSDLHDALYHTDTLGCDAPYQYHSGLL